ncbi:hypothetical protein NDU88_005418 [Pleurodeles waltl]|uniref:Uncharacterized protein n=1 Tax=Pleurodeles waltl TaxID=8319 RepID=A0AAV7QEP3_PLEWA|nr:hypothetical protein NDU88_005418 [Pleurodeles waltl]
MQVVFRRHHAPTVMECQCAVNVVQKHEYLCSYRSDSDICDVLFSSDCWGNFKDSKGNVYRMSESKDRSTTVSAIYREHEGAETNQQLKLA